MSSERRNQADQIIYNPLAYKVCFGCDSIIKRGVNICPNCHAYRFNTDASAIRQQAEVLANKEQDSVTPEDLT